MEKSKRIRSVNWVEEDKILLKELVKTKVADIENKNTDTNTNQRKKKAWLELEERGGSRNVTQLKSQWTLMKIQAKKDTTNRHIKKSLPLPEKILSTNDFNIWQPEEYTNNTNGFDSDAVVSEKMPGINETVANHKIGKLADVEFRYREELHLLQMENERKKARNLDLEYELLLEKIKFYQKKVDGID